MSASSANRRAFVERMAQDPEYAAHGFRLLCAREDRGTWFELIAEAGLLGPNAVPGPSPAENEGNFYIPYWPALDYLEVLSRDADATSNQVLAEQVVSIVRAATAAMGAGAASKDNYHVGRKFAEILGLLPIATVNLDDARDVRHWLDTRFGNDGVVDALSKGPVAKWLSVGTQQGGRLALSVVEACLEIRWVEDKGDPEERTPTTIADDHSLGELLAAHAGELGRQCGEEAARLFRQQVRQVFGTGLRRADSRLYRPAVEKHAQNYRWRRAESRVVEGCRDAVLGWAKLGQPQTREFVLAMLTDDIQMVRRIGLYVIDETWPAMATLLPHGDGELFDVGHLHELYGLLKRRFRGMNSDQRQWVVQTIAGIDLGSSAEDERRTKWTKHRWLSALAGAGYPQADQMWAESSAEFGAVGDHSDFVSYIETWSGPGASPYSPGELLALVENGELISKLNGFVGSGVGKRAPTVEALVQAVERVATQAPEQMLELAPVLHEAKLGYQHAVIAGLKGAWEQSSSSRAEFWAEAWPIAFDYFERIVITDLLWTADDHDTSVHVVTPQWIAATIASVLEAATKNDTTAYPASLLPRGWGLIGRLLDKLNGVETAPTDPMNQAINSPRGKTIEALFSHALRVCRVADRTNGGHSSQWADLVPAFDSELALSRGANFEFSTLAGAYINNIAYLDGTWLAARFDDLFCLDYPDNCRCALGGLAYSQLSRDTYDRLVNSGVLQWALEARLPDEATRKKVVEWVGSAMVQGIEALDSVCVQACFANLEDVQALTWFFSGVADGADTAEKERIVRFWVKVADWAGEGANVPRQLLSSTAELAAALDDIDAIAFRVLRMIAPHVGVGHNAERFFGHLGRLAEIRPAEVAVVLRLVLKAYRPSYDYENRIRQVIETVSRGHLAEAKELANEVRHLPGMMDLFKDLSAGSS